MNKKLTGKGGPNRNQGRHFLNGSKPGQGQYALRHTITLPPEVVEYLKKLGKGNLSKGVREAAEYHKAALH